MSFGVGLLLWYPLAFLPTSIATCWLRTNGPWSLPQASHRAVDLRHRCLEPVYSAHHQEADVWALRHAYFVQQSLHDELCNVELQRFSSMRDKRERTHWKTARNTIRFLAPPVPLFHRLSPQTISAASAVACLLIAGSLISYTITSVSTLPANAVVDVETNLSCC